MALSHPVLDCWPARRARSGSALRHLDQRLVPKPEREIEREKKFLKIDHHDHCLCQETVSAIVG